MVFRGLLKSAALVSATVAFGVAHSCLAQDTSGNTAAWTYSGQQQDPNGVMNPTRTRETHTEVAGRIIDRTSIETLGPDGRYVPYSDTEKESVRVNDTTVRNIERTFGRGPDGQRTLVQEKQEESRNLPDGEKKNVRTTLNPDANGASAGCTPRDRGLETTKSWRARNEDHGAYARRNRRTCSGRADRRTREAKQYRHCRIQEIDPALRRGRALADRRSEGRNQHTRRWRGTHQRRARAPARLKRYARACRAHSHQGRRSRSG